MAEGAPARLSAGEGRSFGLTVGAAFFVLAGVLLWRGHRTPALVLGGVGAALVLGGLLVPRSLGPVQRAWMGLAHLLSRVTTPVFMGMVYYAAILPVGVARRRFGGNPLHHPEVEGSLYVPRDAEHRRSNLQRQF